MRAEHDHLRADTYNCGARPLADNLYGWCKETYEHLGFLYAVGKGMPRQLEMVQVGTTLRPLHSLSPVPSRAPSCSCSVSLSLSLSVSLSLSLSPCVGFCENLIGWC